MKSLIWMIDDDDELRRALRKMFQLLGYEVRDFADGRVAMRAMLAGEMPEVLFLDIQMPHVNGIQLLEFIRSRAEWDHLPVLMLTSESDEERVEQAIRKGADGYVFKPVSFESLQMAIPTAIERRQAAQGE
ncbi:MAG: response regulator [Anaerolineaceae bacterium]|jgi:DNA-binding response OmpR family regulator|nr:response regulator [Anaerolineaceae bacterium]